MEANKSISLYFKGDKPGIHLWVCPCIIKVFLAPFYLWRCSHEKKYQALSACTTSFLRSRAEESGNEAKELSVIPHLVTFRLQHVKCEWNNFLNFKQTADINICQYWTSSLHVRVQAHSQDYQRGVRGVGWPQP